MRIGELDICDKGWTVVTENIGEPVPRLHIVQLYGTDGQRNLSEVLTGRVQYSNRTLTATLEKFIYSHFDRQKEWKLFHQYHGREVEVVMDSDPSSVYTGILNVGAIEQDGVIARIRIDINAQPVKARIVSGILSGTNVDTAKKVTFDDFGERGDISACTFEVLPAGAHLNRYGEIMDDSRNLFINAYKPVVSPTARLIRLINQEAASAYGTATSSISALPHGYRIEQTANTSFPYIRFGSATVSSASMNGMEAGKTYTIRFKTRWKLYSGDTTASQRAYRVVVYYVKPEDSTWTGINSANIGGYIQKGVEQTEYVPFEWSFTVPEDAVGVYIMIRPVTGTNGYELIGDFIEIDDFMFVEGDVIAPDWMPAVSDLHESLYVTYEGERHEPAHIIQIRPEDGKTATIKGDWPASTELDIRWKYTTRDL